MHCCVSAGVRGSPQSRAQGLRRRLDHRHQSAGGNPHLSAAGRAALEGKHESSAARRHPSRRRRSGGFAAARASDGEFLRLTLNSAAQHPAGGRGQLDGARSRYLNNREQDVSQAGQ